MKLEKIAKGALKKAGYKSVADRVRYQSDIAAFAEEVLHIDLAPYQKEILQTFLDMKRIAVRAPHGAGKTALSAIIVLWAVSVFDTDVKVVTTASAWRQLTHFTWPEIHKWAKQGEFGKIGVTLREGEELLALNMVVKDRKSERRALAAASDNPANLEGAHGSIMVVVFDEAKAIPTPVWDALEGAFSTGRAFAIAISTPGAPSGRFYDIHKRKKGYADWAVKHITLDECIQAGRIQREWAEARREQWGTNSTVFQNRVLGNFAEDTEDVVIPLSWVERANALWEERNGVGSGLEAYGLDCGYKGADPSVLAKLVGKTIETIDAYHKAEPMEMVGKVAARIPKEAVIGVDTIGIGAGSYSRLAELGYNAKPVVVSNKTEYRDVTGQNTFYNLRSYIWWTIREWLDPDLGFDLALPPIDELTGDLTAPTWEYMSNGVIRVESKKDISARLGRSTDYADAVGMCLYVAAHRGLSAEDVQKIATGRISVESLSEQIIAFMKSSGVDVEALKERSA